MSGRFRLGVDTGGTFTDAVLIDESTGDIRIGKVPSTPADPAEAFMAASERMLAGDGIDRSLVAFLVHGTTVATNSIIEGKGAHTGFITTEGFRDMLEIARQIRPSLYDLQFEKPRPLVPRYLCFGITERLDARGNVITELDEESVREAARGLKKEGVQAIAVCLLHSYANPDHERRVGEILAEEIPGADVSLSAELVPEFREYFRASTTVVNASVRPIVGRYLESIEKRLRLDDVGAELLVMQSSGGVYTFQAAAERPVFMVESGPAAGVIAAAYVGEALGYDNVISLDMGGTTAKTALVSGGTPRVTKDYEVGTSGRTDTGAGRGSGYPIRTPVIDLVEIGAGGGSIAWVDSGGVLRVGPQSAGAVPGPACYAKGGTEPTITDANLVLGRLNPDYFLGGEIALDTVLAEKAIEARCAKPLGIDLLEAAHGIVEIANAAMVNALRLVSVQRGFDPRDFVLVAFGGAGPVHAVRLANETEIPTTIIPMSPGITSALGLLVTDLKHDFSVTSIRRLSEIGPSEVEERFRSLEEQGNEALERDGVPEAEMSFVRTADMRYVGQSYELGVTVPAGRLNEKTLEAAADAFHREHERAYGHHAPEEPVEFVTLRVTAQGAIEKPRMSEIDKGNGPATAEKAKRPVYFAESGGMVVCRIYDRYRLGQDDEIEGPAIIEEVDSTTVVHPGGTAGVDRFGNLILR